MNTIKIKDSEGSTIICQDSISTIDMYYKSVIGGKPRIVIITKTDRIVYHFEGEDAAESFNNIMSDFIHKDESIVIECSIHVDEANRKYITNINKKYSLIK